ncbi:MAG: phosphate acyltransferase, partial [Candidatus Saccharimonadaceae bacterium]|nr:phosphate acyltransferase [Candidatus Saccharimonadaceae bacterium]
MKIIFPELDNPLAQKAIQKFPDIDFLPAPNLPTAIQLLTSDQADSMISGLDYSSRDVLLAYKDQLPLKSKYFSSCFICERGNTHFALADGGVNKLPTKEQLYTIIEDTAITYINNYHEKPIIAMLSYSTNGSGGKNPDLDKIHYAINQIRAYHPDWIIDGEMQLDAAISP